MAPVICVPSSAVMVMSVIVAANTATVTGSLGGTFFAPNAGLAVIRRLLPATGNTEVDVGAADDTAAADAAAVLRRGACTGEESPSVCPGVMVTVTTSGFEDVHADPVKPMAAMRETAVSTRQ